MSIGQPLKVLNLFDVLVNLIPGTVFILILAILFVDINTLMQLPTGTVVLYIVISYTSGHGIQWLGSEVEGQPRLFGNTVKRIRGEQVDDLDAAIRLSEVEDKFWDLCATEFSLSDNFHDYGRLLQLISVRLEKVGSGRALRFQVLYSFHRSMYAVFLSAIPLTLLAVLVALATGNALLYSQYTVVFVSAIIGTLISEDRMNKFNRQYVSYIIVDFYDSVI